MESPIKIGVSSCLLGNNVRYNGGHAQDRFITGTLGEYVEFVPVCPEVECGLGVPRLTMHLRGDVDNPRLVTTKTGEDHTERMVKWAKKKIGGTCHGGPLWVHIQEKFPEQRNGSC